ncbi:hypothetical protein Patl1_10917 [Pistacia atlantica]|uniref:Uncharacterized protein n=1 Tax=Pistacia atlantica TaxID=434234 RepID=A0ACC1A5P6_9ROSI|nr:hypothetical protein Patl1_10917 [Pistacia atlantica]
MLPALLSLLCHLISVPPPHPHHTVVLLPPRHRPLVAQLHLMTKNLFWTSSASTLIKSKKKTKSNLNPFRVNPTVHKDSDLSGPVFLLPFS